MLVKQESGGLLLLRRTTPLTRRNAVYFCSGAYTFHTYGFAYVPLERLMIGPTPHPELAREVVQSLLTAKGLSATTIQVSSIPYRTW